MKRFHVHLHVQDLDRNIAFYSALLGQPPSRIEPDYAKWMLEDPPVNFAISTRGSQPGVDHLGIQVESAEELQALKARAAAAELALLDEGLTSCCYARSDKYWVTDPQGLAWEQFHTLENIPVFRQGGDQDARVCCAPASAGAQPSATSCCGPQQPTPRASAGCCAPAAAQVTDGKHSAKTCC